MFRDQNALNLPHERTSTLTFATKPLGTRRSCVRRPPVSSVVTGCSRSFSFSASPFTGPRRACTAGLNYMPVRPAQRFPSPENGLSRLCPVVTSAAARVQGTSACFVEFSLLGGLRMLVRVPVRALLSRFRTRSRWVQAGCRGSWKDMCLYSILARPRSRPAEISGHPSGRRKRPFGRTRMSEAIGRVCAVERIEPEDGSEISHRMRRRCAKREAMRPTQNSQQIKIV